MRSLIFNRFGEPSDVLTLEDVPAPEPGEGQVRVRLGARSINPSDVLTVRGQYGRRPKLPATPGYEAAGTIDAVGPGVTGWQVGQRVIPLGIEGTWQEAIIAPAKALMATPEGLPDKIACQMLANPLTAHLLLFDLLDAKAGDWVVQTAAGSTLGQLMIQLAKLNGVNLINVIRSRGGVEALKAAGAEHVVVTEDEDLAARFTEIAGKTPITKAVDAVAGETGGKLATALGFGATLVVYGALSMQPIPLDAGRLIFRGLTVKGFWLTDWFRTATRETRDKTLGEIGKLLASGQLVPPVEAEYDLADVQAAIVHSERPGRTGKIILVG
ncbi:MAG TPA: zinc-dependent alcohol dehydrogenase family protein [Aliidongia sp.]|uniref:zinc-dependent alcohol dehydrogenase family protein n=1 Tax=Aliidongia sp. TaxID=1914230 RepID=UPI002DDCACFD|nr:zinc-dependent alcohol dehydrogenase family protein [Aliidongia sp.]HEV2672984.1 zinc-dependent alcohol dehydrogenase family protein [Aliidongia sp.]